LLDGAPALFVDRGGRSLVPLGEPEESLQAALGALVENLPKMHMKRLAVERFDGQPVGETEIMPLLLEAGFQAGPRRAVLRG
jgi:ATP-dependent Lhr-like helicase